MKKEPQFKVSIVIPVYKPNPEIFTKLKQALKKQTIKAEIVENWNMPEAESTNAGIKKAKGEIIVTLCQDCIPENEFWLERLIKPLLNNKQVVVSVSDVYLPSEFWKTYPFLTKVLTINELTTNEQQNNTKMDARACAYWKKTLIEVNYFNEDPNVIAIDIDLCEKLEKRGIIAHPNCRVMHMHPLTNSKKFKLNYKYAIGSGRLVRAYGKKSSIFWRRLLRATPLIGFLPILATFPFKKYFLLFPVYLLLAPIPHIIYVVGFWRGFSTYKENDKKTKHNFYCDRCIEA